MDFMKTTYIHQLFRKKYVAPTVVKHVKTKTNKMSRAPGHTSHFESVLRDYEYQIKSLNYKLCEQRSSKCYKEHNRDA